MYKKAEFYTVKYKLEESKQALYTELKNGWTDGTFNYYKNGKNWCALVPEYGMAVCFGWQRKEVAIEAHGKMEDVKKLLSNPTYRMIKCKEMIQAAQK